MKAIKYILVLILIGIVAFVVIDYMGGKPNKSKENPYEYNVDEFKKVDPELISHKEVRQLKVDVGENACISSFEGELFFASDKQLKQLQSTGHLIADIELPILAKSIAVNKDYITVASKNQLALIDKAGKIIVQSEVYGDSSLFTSIAILNDNIIVADAGKRLVRIFDLQLVEVSNFEGVSGAKNLHGFIIPSPYFDLAVNAENELWVVNPGMHSLQQYNLRGSLINSWEKISMHIEGFTGCCNPAQFTTLPDGRFVTSEKGMPRIKIHSKTGELESVVAAPDKFKGETAAELAVLSESVIAVLDYDQSMIRIFEEKNDEK